MCNYYFVFNYFRYMMMMMSLLNKLTVVLEKFGETSIRPYFNRQNLN